ncbi:hypothetical protein [Microbacterium sp. MPKO10]|uniref:hypothetical protein n=1 Tax=Microbacterium sp. MPKO10 TaxID=2989818 RepID=UPI0022356016|nr:hypothetical protein [Microbacterium sp. MPKO10]MCW4457499.1 hypothetical protein [Microbacterium sp. MPKO10]
MSSEAGSTRSPFWTLVRAETSIVTVVLGIVAITAATFGTIDSLTDAGGDRVTGSFAIVAPSVIAAWACVEAAWRPSPHALHIRLLVRCLVLPLPVAVASAVETAVVTGLPTAQRIIDEAAAAHNDFHYYWGDGSGALAGVWTLFGGYGVGAFIGLMTFLIITFPLVAILHARYTMRSTDLDLGEEHAQGNRAGLIRTTLGLSASTLAIVLIIYGVNEKHGDGFGESLLNAFRVLSDVDYLADLAWIIGIVLIPIAVVLFVWAMTSTVRNPDGGEGVS